MQSLSFPSAGASCAVVASASPPSGVTEGGALRLACCSPAAGSQAHYSWFKSTSTSTGPSHSGQVWNISQVTSDNSGTFYCQVHTGDKVQKSAPLSLDVECRSSLILMQLMLKHHVNSAVWQDFFYPVFKSFNLSSLLTQTLPETHFYRPPKRSPQLWPAAATLTHPFKRTPGTRAQHVSPQQTKAFTQWGIRPLRSEDQAGQTRQPASPL